MQHDARAPRVISPELLQTDVWDKSWRGRPAYVHISGMGSCIFEARNKYSSARALRKINPYQPDENCYASEVYVVQNSDVDAVKIVIERVPQNGDPVRLRAFQCSEVPDSSASVVIYYRPLDELIRLATDTEEYKALTRLMTDFPNIIPYSGAVHVKTPRARLNPHAIGQQRPPSADMGPEYWSKASAGESADDWQYASAGVVGARAGASVQDWIERLPVEEGEDVGSEAPVEHGSAQRVARIAENNDILRKLSIETFSFA